VTALDVIGPYEILSRWPSTTSTFVVESLGPVVADMGAVFLPTDILDDSALLAWIRAVVSAASWATSVCSGAGVYAAAGVIRDRKATTHWGCW
jgi:transcriptional regulator GlxA family with amidase domain